MTAETTRRETRLTRPSNLVLLVVLVAAAIGAISLVRQRPDPRLATPVPPPAWALAGHDMARTGHSLSNPARLPLTLRWWRPIPLGVQSAVIDGHDNTYLTQPDGALLALDAGGNTRWCAAMQPITDTSCSGTLPPLPPRRLLPPVTPNATIMVGPDSRLYIMVVGAGGILRAFVPSSPYPSNHAFPELIPADGVAYNPTNATFYGVVATPRSGAAPGHAVIALHWPGNPLWRSTAIPSRAFTPVSIAPDGTLLVAASAPASGGYAALYALDARGRVRWHIPLAPGKPSVVSVQGVGGRWIAWVAVAGATRSWVVVADVQGRTLWRWSTGHPLAVLDGGVSLAHPTERWLASGGLAYAGSTVGVYALDLARRHAWLFFDTRAWGAGASGSPTTDAGGTVYLGTQSGWVFAVRPNVRSDRAVRWRYQTGRDARSVPVLDPDGTLLIIGHSAGGDVVEALGAGGQPLQTVGPAICAQPDCPTPTVPPLPTVTLTATLSVSPTASLPVTITPTSTATIPSS